MPYKALYILVEGDDDERFFKKILLPRLREKHDYIKVIQYAQKPKKFEYIKKFIKSIQSMGDYIYVTDINDSPCITAKKQEIQDKLKNIDEDRILVVIKEIESWYLAGLDDTCSKKFRISLCDTTDDLTKKQFNNLIPKKFGSRIAFMQEILKCFNIETAKHKNESFRYFCKKYDCKI